MEKLGLINYHELTKHHFNRYARSLGYMDWENQPIPFRFYENTKRVALPLLEQDPKAKVSELFARRVFAERKISLEVISGILELSMGLSAWKSTGQSKWALRMNPSSGNLHPTEVHLLVPKTEDLTPGVYHYNPLFHALEHRATLPDQLSQKLHKLLGGEGFYIAFTTIFWRESWKYGERSYRYCNHDVGHAIAAVSFAANLFGLRLVAICELSTDQQRVVLGFDKVEWPEMDEEHPDLICSLVPSQVPREETSKVIPCEIVNAISKLDFVGQPNPLSSTHYSWEAIDRASKLANKPQTEAVNFSYQRPLKIELSDDSKGLSGPAVIRKRRSAVDFNQKKSVIEKPQFLTCLGRTLAIENTAPFDVEIGFSSQVHLLVFVHNVTGLSQGLYFFSRNQDHYEEIRRLSKKEFSWDVIDENLPLYGLAYGDLRKEAEIVSCHQAIAGDSAFSLGMIARFAPTITSNEYRYPELFWEAGMVGQILYLEAEAHGLRGTGIGCFFDDPVHFGVLGIEDLTYQSLYHFTVGYPLEDTRLQTLAPYDHLTQKESNKF